MIWLLEDVSPAFTYATILIRVSLSFLFIVSLYFLYIFWQFICLCLPFSHLLQMCTKLLTEEFYNSCSKFLIRQGSPTTVGDSNSCSPFCCTKETIFYHSDYHKMTWIFVWQIIFICTFFYFRTMQIWIFKSSILAGLL